MYKQKKGSRRFPFSVYEADKFDAFLVLIVLFL